MYSRKLLTWFEQKRRSKVLNLAQRHITQSANTVKELNRALIAFAQGKDDEVKATIKRLFTAEVEIDDLRRTVLAELTKGELPYKYREDLRGLIERLDSMADHVKDSARSILVLMETTVPEDIMKIYLRMGQHLEEEVHTLEDCIEVLGSDPERVDELATKVDFYEGKVDEEYLRLKSLLIKHGKTLDAATLMTLRDLVEFMERTADICINTADYLRTLAAGVT